MKDYALQTGVGKTGVGQDLLEHRRMGFGAAGVPTTLYVQHDPSGRACPPCDKAIAWADDNGSTGMISPGGTPNGPGYTLRFSDDPGMPQELISLVGSETYPSANIGGVAIAGWDQAKYDAAVVKNTPGSSTGAGMSTTTKALLVGAGVLAAGGLAYVALGKKKRKKHRR